MFCVPYAFLLAACPVFASRAILISTDKSTLFSHEELMVTASASGFTDGEQIYIKGAFFRQGSANYFGYTKSGDVWVKNSTTNTQQRSVTIGVWDGILSVKNDYEDSGFSGEGDYGLKVAFYYQTSGGNISSVNWSDNTVSVHLQAPDPTPTTTPAPSHTPTPTPRPKTDQPLTGTPTRKPTPAPTNKPTAQPISVISPSPISTSSVPVTPTNTRSAGIPAVLGTTEGPATASVQAETETKPPGKPLIFSLLLVGIGCAILSLVFVWKQRNALKPPGP